MDIPVDWTKIEDMNSKDIPYFELENFETEAKCIEVYDGDTIKVIFPYFGKLYKWRCRLLRINAPEMRGPSKENGIISRDILRSYVLGKIIKVKCGKFDAFGRILSEIECDGENISDKLLNETDGLVKKFE